MFGTKATTLNIGAFLLVLSAIQFAQAAEFGRATNYAVGHAPVFVATGDLNADGVPDLAVANDADGTVSILLGNPDGTFQTAVSYSAGPSPVSIATGDYNGDGAQDLAVANFDWSSQINVLPGNGDGTFRTAVSYSLATYRPSSVVSGDFNGDGALDLAVATVNDSINGGSIAILLGNGDGTFQEAVAYPGGVWALSLVAADFNEDKRLDLAFANYADGFGSSVSVVLGNGDGTFQGMVGYLVGQGVGAIAVGDLNGDGKLDLAVNDNSATCLFGNGDGTFQKSSTSNGTFSNLAVVLADFNKDGKLDVAAPNPTQVSVILGKGDSTFYPQEEGYPTRSNPGSVAVADFNGDGLLDIAEANTAANNVGVLLNLGTSPAVTLSTHTVGFLTEKIGDTSPPRQVTLTNSGYSELDISSVTVSGSFLEKNTCGSKVAIQASCTITVAFRPRTPGLQTGTVTITDNAQGQTQIIRLRGFGTP